MSQENVEVVRKPLAVRERSSRTLDQRLLLRFPRLNAATARLIGRLPPRSRLRQAAVWRGFRLATEAFNRRDLDAIRWAATRLRVPPGARDGRRGLLEPCYRGAAGYRNWVSDWSDVLVRISVGSRRNSSTWGTGSWCSRACPCALRPAASRSPGSTRMSYGEDGRAIREQQYSDQAEALEAVGLRE